MVQKWPNVGSSHIFFGSPRKSGAWPGEQAPPALGCPARKRGGKGEKPMYQNRVSIIGFVGNDVQLRATKTGASVAVFSVATQSSWRNASGSYDSRTDWHRCVAWGSLSQFAAKLEKGAHVQVEGELRYREYEKQYGTKKAPAPVKHRVAEIHINRILKLDRAEKQDEPAPEVDPSELPADEPTA